MPKNRNAQLRYQIIDKCLQNRGRKWTWQNILIKVNEALIQDNPKSKGIGKTTLYEDFKDIEYRVYAGEIERMKDGKTIFLRYADSAYSISNHPLNETEINQLKSAILILTRFTGVPQFEWVNEIIPVLESKLGIVKTNAPVISLDSNLDYVGIEHLPVIFNAIINKSVLKISYQDFKSPTIYHFDFHPYYIKQFNSRWYAFGYDPEFPSQVKNLALDRIKNIVDSKCAYKSSKINWDDYFSDIVGVTKFPKEAIIIKILILDAEQAAYIQTKPFHQSQKQLKKVQDGFETSITVVPNYELEKLILSFGSRLKVISPKIFKDKIAKHAHKLYSLYI